MNQSIHDIMAERAVQISRGYDSKHDDNHPDQSIALVAALVADPFPSWAYDEGNGWPEGTAAHIINKHKRRRQLVIAAAMLVAEIERLDRSCSRGVSPLTPQELSESRALIAEARRLDAAASKPWYCAADKNGDCAYWIIDGSPRLVYRDKTQLIHKDDMEFIATSRTLLPQLATLLETAIRELEAK